MNVPTLPDSALPPVAPSEPASPINWSYQEAFSRNLGLISAEEQQRLRRSRIAIAGMGGVGGVDLVALARLGIGHFTIADPDVFEVVNANRQYGAFRSTLGRPKAEVMAEIVRDINPSAEVRVFNDAITEANAHSFLEGADVLVDGIDAFAIAPRRLLFRLAAKQGIFALGAGPVGFGTVWVIFNPRGMSFDRYFNLSDEMDDVDQFVSYIIGMAPRAFQRSYMDLDHVDVRNHRGPSASAACDLAAGVVGIEVLKILLQRGPLYAAPHFHQFDAYLGRYVRGRLWLGNRHPWQRLKHWWLARHLRRVASAQG